MLTPDLSRARWRTSSYTQGNGACVEVAYLPAEWRTSSYSSANGTCVEVARGDRAVGIRDTKHRTGPALLLDPAALTALVARIKAISVIAE